MNEKAIHWGFIILIIFLLKLNSGYAEDRRADSILHQMTVDEKIGQLIMLPAYSNKSSNYYAELESTIKKYHIGGIIFFQGTPQKQKELTIRFQKLSSIPLFIGMDAEWGLGMRLGDVKSFPRNMTLGAIRDKRLVYNLGAEIARQCKIMGVHINFAPVLDVNNNPLNPVINMRSFGENPDRVSQLGQSYIYGLQDNGILAVGKHFPGHGDTGKDSHYDLPIIPHDKARLDSVELKPFQNAVKGGLSGIMVAHLNVPALERKKQWPVSLSSKTISGVLKEELEFEGLVFTDAMNMKGVTNILPPGEAELNAFLAGNDVLVMPVNISEVFKHFKAALNKKIISMDELDNRVLKILKFKNKYIHELPISYQKDELLENLNNNTGGINELLFKNSITIVQDKHNILPFKVTDTISFASLSIDNKSENFLQTYLSKYGSFNHYSINSKDNFDRSEIFSLLKKHEVVILGLHNISYYPGKKYGLSEEVIQFIHDLDKQTNLVLVIFGNPYSIKYFQKISTVVSAYENLPTAQKVVPQILFGAEPAIGKLPVTVSPTIIEGAGIIYSDLGRLSFSTPTNEDLNENYLKLIDSTVVNSINNKTIPGCQVLVARRGRVIYNKNFGFHTYDSLLAVTDSSIYDLASITKVAGTIQALMMLVEKDEIDLDKKISYYLPELRGTNKENMIIRDILTHQAGLLSYMPYWKYTLKRYKSSNDNYRFTETEGYDIEIIPGLFAKNSLPDTIWSWMVKSDLLEKEDSLKPYEYKYSDIGFYLIKKLIDQQLNYTLDELLEEYLYTPLNLKYLTYNPKKKFSQDQIVPSTLDNYFREAVVQGNVHDEIGAIFGGIAGHAGLFSNALDLAVIMQMNLQKGYYGGVKYFQAATIEEFTSRQYKRNRRGLGWDKPQMIGDEYNPSSFFGSADSYGHSGFTGTFVWVDPEFELIYIFLSNRTYPDSNNVKLMDEDVRKRIQTIIYSSIIKDKS